MLFKKQISSPVGRLTLIATEDALSAILWQDDKPGRVRLGEIKTQNTHPVLLRAEKQLSEYFKGERETFDLKIEFQGTAFQKKVWNALRKIPYGKTRSYGELAEKIGSPKSSRAVGAANGRNPISIIVPCHRVIGANGKLTGFAGGLENKAKLLKLENKLHSLIT